MAKREQQGSKGVTAQMPSLAYLPPLLVELQLAVEGAVGGVRDPCAVREADARGHHGPLVA